MTVAACMTYEGAEVLGVGGRWYRSIDPSQCFSSSQNPSLLSSPILSSQCLASSRVLWSPLLSSPLLSSLRFRFLSTPISTYQLTNLPTYQLTNLPTYQLTNLPTYQPTNLPTSIDRPSGCRQIDRTTLSSLLFSALLFSSSNSFSPLFSIVYSNMFWPIVNGPKRADTPKFDHVVRRKFWSNGTSFSYLANFSIVFRHSTLYSRIYHTRCILMLVLLYPGRYGPAAVTWSMWSPIRSLVISFTIVWIIININDIL